MLRRLTPEQPETMTDGLRIHEGRPIRARSRERSHIGGPLPPHRPPSPIMGQKDPRIDAYIAKAPPFAQPILTHIRAVVHEGCPDVVETMKWSSPFFDYAGGPLCMM